MESPEVITFSDDFDSACSTPFVSAPSSPGRTSHHPTGFFYSAPASPIHYMISSSSSKPKKGSVTSTEQPPGPFQFETETQTFTSGSTMTSADELFFNGQIRPMKLSSHLQRPQVLSPLLDIHNENENENENDEDDDDDDVTEEPVRGRDYRSKSLRRRARSMSPLRTNTAAFEWLEEEFEQEGTRQQLEAQEDKINNNNNNNNDTSNKTKLSEMETTPSGASSRSSSVGRSSKRWVFLKEFLYRSKSEGRTSTSTSTSSSHSNTNNIKFWTSLSFSPNKEKKIGEEGKGKGKVPGDGNGNVGAKKAVNGVSNRRLGRSARSAHEVHYTLNRAQSEEMRRKTYLPYKQGLLGCLGFSSKSYGAMNGFARALNPVSSR